MPTNSPPKDFFARQEMARRNTGWLLGLYLLAILGIIATLYLVWQVTMEGPLWDPEVLAGVAGGVILIVGLGALFKISQLSGGGSRVAEMLGGRLVDPLAATTKERQLLNVVEEMALASGLPSPAVYVLPEDASINAFAAGFTVDDAVVGVTRGTLERLTRDELQGVIAHEFSHILNGDMRLNLRLMGLLFGILCLAVLGRIILRLGLTTRSSSSSDGKGAAGVFFFVALGVALFLVGMIGVFFARLIQAAVSRQREYLADAAAVQFTRNPHGIASALHKIGLATGRISSPDAAEAGHLFFGNGLAESWFGWLSTHPPLQKRIEAIAPDFDPSSVRVIPRPPTPPMDGKAAAVPRDWMGRRAESMPAGLASGLAGGLAEGGAPAGTLEGGAVLLGELEAGLREELRELGGAVALVFALLLDEGESVRGVQLQALGEAGMEVATLEQVQRWFCRRGQWSSRQKITLVDLAIPTLRQLSPRQFEVFRRQTHALIGADGQVHLFEYLLQKILTRHLDRFFHPGKKPPPLFGNLLPVLPDVAVVLSALAYVGQRDEAMREAAYRAGVRELLVRNDDPALQRLDGPGIEQLDRALQRLAQAAEPVRRQILLAAGQVVMEDGGANETEGELLRALADAIDVPVPPFVIDGPAVTP